MVDDQEPASPEELAAAEALRRTLDSGASAGDGEDARAAGLIAASAGRARPLGEITARAIARRAFNDRRARMLRRRGISGLLGAAIAAMVLVTLAPGGVPRRWQSRSGGLLVGPFPPQQTEAQRLDLVLGDRMVALRERRLYGAHR